MVQTYNFSLEDSPIFFFRMNADDILTASNKSAGLGSSTFAFI